MRIGTLFFLARPLWALSRLRYDRRALLLQTLVAWTVFLLSATLTTDLTGPAGNLNMIYGLSETKPQIFRTCQLRGIDPIAFFTASVAAAIRFGTPPPIPESPSARLGG